MLRLAELHVAAARVRRRGQRVLRLLDALDARDVAAEPAETHAQRRFQHRHVRPGTLEHARLQDARIERGIALIVAQHGLDLVERRIEPDVQIALVAAVDIARLAVLDLERARRRGPERGGGEHGDGGN